MKKNDCLFSNIQNLCKAVSDWLIKKINNPIRTNETIPCACCHMSMWWQRNQLNPDSPFYVASRTVPLRDPENDKWFINQRVGRKKLSKMMKQMQITGELNPAKRLTNHSARKHLVQRRRDSDVAPTDIMQISGHKKIQTGPFWLIVKWVKNSTGCALIFCQSHPLNQLQ